MPINWGLAQNYDIGGAVMQGMQAGTQQRMVSDRRNALASLVTNPNDTSALNALARVDPESAMGVQKDLRLQQQQQRDKQAGDMRTMRQLLVTAKDDPMRAFSAAQSMGIDVSGIPNPNDPNFKPWVDEQLFIMDALEKPGGMEALSTAGKMAVDMGYKPGTPEFNAKVGEIFKAEQIKTIPYQAGGGVASYNPATGEIKPIVVPEAQPTQQSAVAPPPEQLKAGAVVDGYVFKGGNPADPEAWEQQGGQTPQASGNFQP